LKFIKNHKSLNNCSSAELDNFSSALTNSASVNSRFLDYKEVINISNLKIELLKESTIR